MYFLVSTYNKITSDGENGEDIVRYAESPQEKIYVAFSTFQASFKMLSFSFKEKVSKLIIINPTKNDIHQVDIKNFLKGDYIRFRDARLDQITKTCVVINSSELKIKTDSDKIQRLADSMKIAAIRKIIGKDKVIFTSNALDHFTVKILKGLPNTEGYRYAFNTGKPHDRIVEYPINNTNDYLEFVSRCFMESSESDRYLNENLYSLNGTGIKRTKSGKLHSKRSVIHGFLNGQISKLIIQTDDEYLTSGISVELQTIMGKLYEYDVRDNNYEIKKYQKGLIYYNIHLLPGNQLYALCAELKQGEYKDKPVILFSKEKIIELGSLGFEKYSLPSLKDDNITKMRLLLTLLAKNQNLENPIEYKRPFLDFLIPFTKGEEIKNFIVENKIGLFNVRNIDFWYELKEKYNPVIHYKFEHIKTSKGDKWAIVGDTIEEPIPAKYHPNKCLMYIAYLININRSIDVVDLVEAVENWIFLFTRNSAYRKTKKILPKHKRKSKNPFEGKTPQELALNSIQGTFAYYFGLTEHGKKEKNTDEAEYLKFLYTEGYITISTQCCFKPKGKIHIDVKDDLLEKLLVK